MKTLLCIIGLLVGCEPFAATTNTNQVVTTAFSRRILTNTASAGVRALLGMTSTNTLTVYSNVVFGSTATLTTSLYLVTITGTRTNDIPLLGKPADAPSGIIFAARCTNDAVIVEANNVTAVSITPGTLPFRIDVLQR